MAAALRRNEKNTEFSKGLPPNLDDDEFFDPNTRTVIILDDLMSDIKKDARIADLFTRGSHHDNASVIYVAQNLFDGRKSSRDIDLNCQYIQLFNSPVDRQQVALLGRRIFPGRGDFFMREYNEAVTGSNYGSLLIDLKPTTPETQRLRKNFLGRGSLYTKSPPPWFKQDGNGLSIKHDIWRSMFEVPAREELSDAIDREAEQYRWNGYDAAQSIALAESGYVNKMKELLRQKYKDWFLNRTALDNDSIHAGIEKMYESLLQDMDSNQASEESIALGKHLLEKLYSD